MNLSNGYYSFLPQLTTYTGIKERSLSEIEGDITATLSYIILRFIGYFIDHRIISIFILKIRLLQISSNESIRVSNST